VTAWMTLGGWKFFTWRNGRIVYFLNESDQVELALQAV
jgi:hypothetical protein